MAQQPNKDKTTTPPMSATSNIRLIETAANFNLETLQYLLQALRQRKDFAAFIVVKGSVGEDAVEVLNLHNNQIKQLLGL